MDKKVVRASYESCLDATARLAAYATSKPLSKASDVSGRQDILAADDLIAFSIHARRLIDNVTLYDFTNQMMVKCADGSSMSLWRVLGALIHHDELVILRCATRLRMLEAMVESKTDDEYWERVMPELTRETYSEPVPPLILFKSDKVARTVVDLVELLQIFSQEILTAVIKRASDEGLYLDDDPFEDVDVSDKAIEVLSQLRHAKQAS